MTEQTEQEPIDPIAQCIRWLSFMVVNQEDRRMVQAELESIAAQVRERDAQIARKETALNSWRGWAQFVYIKGGPVTLDDEALRDAVCATHDAETATLRAERDRWKAVGEYCEREWENVQLPRVRKAEAERDAARQEIVEKDALLTARRETIAIACWSCGLSIDQPAGDCTSHMPWNVRLYAEMEQSTHLRARITGLRARLHVMESALREVSKYRPTAAPEDPGYTGNCDDQGNYMSDLAYWWVGGVAQTALDASQMLDITEHRK